MSESMTNAEYFDEIYTMCIVSKEDVLTERADLTAEYIAINTMLYARFINNRNVTKAITYFNDLMRDFFSETEFELQVYEAMLDYFNSFACLSDCYELECLDEFEDILLEFDSCVDQRFIESMTILEHFRDIIASNILTDKNYFVKGLTNKTSQEMKNNILAKIPGGSKDV
ncbi:MAG: hypothetical protein OSJ70_07520 [Bacilli bacterium]|mgnify:FL=1|nr:hypothetical protein [Bacilli bacterium]